MKRESQKQVRREIFVLTPEEKRMICFVLIALVLGLATKHYRATPPAPSSVMEAKSNTSASPNSAPKRVKKDRPPPPK